ncbi:fatty acid desaturase family protein [Dyadobacter sediminis]|uniref:Acyl-CoA desaturase n=1 Tax=Dyadobacter sediminis TaxID=1493691 RepID=A0A5R9KDL1_9BACT|nr:acyl-CoA desaturase [Dyadobacter sediminis]TLU94121.1 acyl-CoA desaturase [Dyadobacter sediminis]GGB94045.1 fatty acid desaturase [Dyadobacter sediminis]
MKYQKIKFVNVEKSTFFPTLRQRVDQYFASNELCKSGGRKILYKAFFMLGLYLIPYLLILSGYFSGLGMIVLAIVMGFGVAGVGMSVMHDAIHGSLATSNILNRFFGASIYLLGGNAYNWEVQHNRLHHTYTNIHEVDEDITGKFLLRLSFQEKQKYIHRFQHIYAFFLYSLMTISFLWKDFKEISFFNKMSASGMTKPFPRKELVKLIFSKLAYVAFICVIPLCFTTLTFGEWLAGFFIMHCTAGMILSTVFQMAHVVEGVNQPAPDHSGSIENAWAVHQLQTTSNFAGKNRILSWYIGGLDYQIEHHLFPSISHIHYHALSPIVRQTAIEFGLDYNAKRNFTNALGSHVRMLKSMGKKHV